MTPEETKKAICQIDELAEELKTAIKESRDITIRTEYHHRWRQSPENPFAMEPVPTGEMTITVKVGRPQRRLR